VGYVNIHKSRKTLRISSLFAGDAEEQSQITLGLGLATTNIYAEVDLDMKAKALANCEVKGQGSHKPWREDKGLMEFLRSL